jgi:DNA-binding MarR family transcriptional regulator
MQSMKKANTSMDSESRVGEEHHNSLRLWLRILTCTNLVENELRGYLRDEFDSTLPRFDFLAQLERHPQGLRMGELSRLMMVSGGNVTGIATQLEKEGLIKRETSQGDRRSFVVRLTTKGRRRFKRMAEDHETWVIEMFSGMDVSEINALLKLLGKLKAELTQFKIRGRGKV